IGEGIGGAIGPLFAGYICDTTGSYELAIIIGATAFLIGAGLSLIVKTPSYKQTKLVGHPQ
ncbi:MAG: oxalate:formate antiporter, partial [Dehalococcoidia bacterium]|nr:oxalate:formate antiporter [Dehalococcoidia bacterium]